MSSSSDQTSDEELQQIFQHVKDAWPKELGNDTWYLSVAATCIACSRPTIINPLYKTLASATTPPDQQIQISTRLKDLFMKTWTITGIPSVITAVTCLAQAEAQFHQQSSPTSTSSSKSPSEPPHTKQTLQNQSHYQSHQLTPDLESKGFAFMQKIYRQNLDPIMSTWGPLHQPDFEWLEKRIIYGLFLADHTVLNEIETEIVVLSAMLCQELKAPALWHVRGLRRVGVSREGVEGVVECVRVMQERWGGGRRVMDGGWVDVGDVEDEV